MELPLKYLSCSETDTAMLAYQFSRILKPGKLVLLKGELGTGKTFFVKKVCEQFQIENASSPSFAIVNVYYGSMKIYHFDFYRIKKPAELYDIGWDDYLNDSEAIIFIEWPDLFPEVLPAHFIEVQILLADRVRREFYISEK